MTRSSLKGAHSYRQPPAISPYRVAPSPASACAGPITWARRGLIAPASPHHGAGARRIGDPARGRSRSTAAGTTRQWPFMAADLGCSSETIMAHYMSNHIAVAYGDIFGETGGPFPVARFQGPNHVVVGSGLKSVHSFSGAIFSLAGSRARLIVSPSPNSFRRNPRENAGHGTGGHCLRWLRNGCRIRHPEIVGRRVCPRCKSVLAAPLAPAPATAASLPFDNTFHHPSPGDASSPDGTPAALSFPRRVSPPLAATVALAALVVSWFCLRGFELAAGLVANRVVSSSSTVRLAAPRAVRRVLKADR